MIQLHSQLKENFGKDKSQRGEMKRSTISENGLGDERLVHMVTEAPKSAGSRLQKDQDFVLVFM